MYSYEYKYMKHGKLDKFVSFARSDLRARNASREDPRGAPPRDEAKGEGARRRHVSCVFSSTHQRVYIPSIRVHLGGAEGGEGAPAAGAEGAPAEGTSPEGAIQEAEQAFYKTVDRERQKMVDEKARAQQRKEKEAAAAAEKVYASLSSSSTSNTLLMSSPSQHCANNLQ